MPKNKWILIFFVCFINLGYGQKLGYYGNRFFVDIDAQAQLPLVQTIFGGNSGYVEQKGQFVEQRNWKDFGLRASFNYVATKKMAFGIEISQRYYNINPLYIREITRSYKDSDNTQIVEHLPATVTFFSVNETNFMPRFLFSWKDANLPIGFSSEIGLGYSLIHLSSVRSKVKLDPQAPYSSNEVKEKLIDPKAQNFQGANAMFGIRLNFPLTKHVLFHVGFRYQYAMMLQKKKYRTSSDSEFWFSPREMWSKTNERRQLGIFSFGTGFTFTF